MGAGGVEKGVWRGTLPFLPVVVRVSFLRLFSRQDPAEQQAERVGTDCGMDWGENVAPKYRQERPMTCPYRPRDEKEGHKEDGLYETRRKGGGAWWEKVQGKEEVGGRKVRSRGTSYNRMDRGARLQSGGFSLLDFPRACGIVDLQ